MSTSAAVLATLDSALDRLAGLDPQDLADLPLLRRIADLQQRVNRLQALQLRDVATAHRRGAAVTDGFASTQALLRRRLRLDPRDASRQVATATALDQLPDTAAALSAGEIAVEHAAEIARAMQQLGEAGVAVGAEKLLLDEARTEVPARVRRVARLLRDRHDPDGDDGARLFKDRWLDVARTFSGMVSVQGMLDPVTGELLMNALGGYTDRPRPDGAAGDEADDRGPGQRRVDALGELCRVALADPGGKRPALPQLTVTVTLDGLRDAVATSGVAATPGVTGPALLGAYREPINAVTARRLACDAGIIPAVLGSPSEPLDIGRLTRSVPVGMRRALELRDRGCRYPGCDRPGRRCDGHHLHHWARSGPTSLTNLVLLCAFHHWLVHEGGWSLHYDSANDILTAYRPDGTRYDLTSGPRNGP